MSIPFSNESFGPTLIAEPRATTANKVAWPERSYDYQRGPDNRLPDSETLAKRAAHVVKMAHQALLVLHRSKTLPLEIIERTEDDLDRVFAPTSSPEGVLDVPKAYRRNGIGLLVTKPGEQFMYGRAFTVPAQEQKEQIHDYMAKTYPDQDAEQLFNEDKRLLDNDKSYDPQEHIVRKLGNGAARTDKREVLFKSSYSVEDSGRTKRYKDAPSRREIALRAWFARPLIVMSTTGNGKLYPLQLAHQLAHARQVSENPYIDIENDTHNPAHTKGFTFSPEAADALSRGDMNAARLAMKNPYPMAPRQIDEDNALLEQRIFEQGLLLADSSYAPLIKLGYQAYRCSFYPAASEAILGLHSS